MTPATPPSAINLQLSLGSMAPSPAPLYITEKLESVEITCNSDGPCGFQLLFHADRAAGLSQDFQLLSSSLLQPTTRALISVAMNGNSTVLMDGFITRQELGHSKEFSASTLTITGEDVSVLMDRMELPLEYPEMGDSMIALLVLSKYSVLGVIPEVVPTAADLVPSTLERTPQQNCTDRCYLRQLASPYGYNFSVSPGPAPLTNIAYWGPPVRVGAVNAPLSVDMGPATNVESLTFQFDYLAPVLVFGMVQDTELETDLPLATLASTRWPPFAQDPALDALSIFQRRNIFTDPRYGYLRALVEAQATTDVSTDAVVTGQGEVDTVRYGDILKAGGLVDVRGVGESYDGRYYIKSVTHSIRRGSYKQSFTLTREGVGSTISRVST